MKAEDWIPGQRYSYPHIDGISLWVSYVREVHCWNCQIGLYTSCYERITIYPEDVGTEEIVKLAGCWNCAKKATTKNKDKKQLWTGKKKKDQTTLCDVLHAVLGVTVLTLGLFDLDKCMSLLQCHVCPHSRAIHSVLLTRCTWLCVICCCLPCQMMMWLGIVRHMPGL